MSEQQTPQPKQNIVRFPASKKERRKLLRESKDKRVRLVSALRFACGWLLVIGAFLFLLGLTALIQQLAADLENFLIQRVGRHSR